MPEQHKAAQNGVVNAGSAALALKYREFVIHSEVCLERLRECCAPNILSALTLHGQMNLAMLFNFLTSNEDHSWRRKLMKAGAVPSLLRLHKMLVTGGAAKENGKALDACRQALAHIALVTNPELYPYQDAADLVPVMLLMARDSQNELHQFEACMALTNLAASAEVRDFVISADGWNYALDLLFSSNERVQCVAMELMNNLAGDEKIVEKMGKKCERCMEGKGVDDAPAEIKIMLSFCGVVTRNEAEMARLEKEEAEEEKEESDDEKIEDWPGRKKKPQVVQTKEESAGLKGGEGDGKDPNAELRNILCGRKKGKVDRAALDQNDKRMLIAASGCLAQLTQDTTICRMISVTPQFHHLLDLVAWSGPGADADAEFRAVAAICNLVACDEVIGHVRHLAQSAIEKKIASKTGLLHPKSKENYEFFKEWQKENGRL
ncbi:unnamed protein product [Amoebophrya sp. A25]|nr:unnamed protein product [Amoebophrya sp. A25]|eukprot:GSA25T00002622001.1